MAAMVRLQTMIIVVLIVVIIALAAILFIVYERPAALGALSPTKNESQVITQKTTPPRPTQQLSPELDRYLQKAPISKDSAAIRTERQMQETKMARLKELQAKFKEISVNGKTPDIDELDRLLGELVDIQGTSVIGGIDLNTLRQNLRVAQEIQVLAKKLEEESKKPERDQNRILEITKKIQGMQGDLNPNIMAGGSEGALGVPPVADTEKDQKGL